MSRLRIAWLMILPLALLGLQAASSATKKEKIKIRAVDTYVVGDQVFVPGTQASVRVLTMGATGLVSSRPIPLANVTVTLQGGKSKAERLFRGRSDFLGIVDARFQVPAWPDGSYEMVVRTQTPFGKGEVKRSVSLKRTGKILLVTDKPIYQPRQLIHMRALALNSHDLRPLGKQQIRLEVQDPKGNKVFKKKLATDDYGIASAQFQLADEINLGNYQIDVTTEDKNVAEPASKTVVVKKYVLPKFKVEVDTDRAYYLPRQTIKGKIRADYFFGKPVAGGEVEVKASTFDVAFKEFATLRGRTGKDGKWEFELKLPDYFVGQPLQKGDALVKLEVKVSDTAKHREKSIKSVPVAADPIRLSAVPEGGRLVAEVDNRIYLVATYPDGSPARATVVARKNGQEIGKTRTDETGLGLVVIRPKTNDMRDGGWQPRGSFGRDRRRFAARQQPYVRSKILDLAFEAQDERGNKCQIRSSFSTDPEGDRVLVRTDKAIYVSGDTIKGTVLTTAGDGTAYLDLIKNRQTLLTSSFLLSKGKGEFKVSLGPEVFGTIELHAYKILKDGNIMRDARVLYVQPPKELKINISREKSIYRPGEDALFKFRVVDNSGKPAAAALGVIIVDEAVYALQELKPGLEKVYFTLEKELSEPKYQIEFAPAENLSSLVKAKKIQAQKQQVAKVLLAKAEPQGDPSLWSNPLKERMQKAQNDRYYFQSALYQWAQQHPMGRRTKDGKWKYRKNLVSEMVKGKVLRAQNAKDPLGDRYTMETVETLWPELRAEFFLAQHEFNRVWNLRSQVYNRLYNRTSGFKKPGDLEALAAEAFQEALNQPYVPKKDLAGKPYRWKDLKDLPGFSPMDLAGQIHAYRAQRIYAALSRYGRDSQRWFRVSVLDKKKNAYNLPEDAIRRVVKRGYLRKEESLDLWGRPFRLRKLKEARKQVYYDHRLRFYEVFSTGADGKPDTKDDLAYSYPVADGGYQALAKAIGFDQQAMSFATNQAVRGGGMLMALEDAEGDDLMMDGAIGLGGMARKRAAKPTAKAAPPAGAMPMHKKKDVGRDLADKEAAGPAAPKKREVRIREYFPETLLFAPSLITDHNGQAELKVAMADSITTWRMTASANGRHGGLGSVSHGIRVFQDFFVDLDLPVSLTQNDEVSIPVVVYNYLKGPQRVRLEMERGDWFELEGNTVQEMTIDPGEVEATYYRIKVKGLGRRTLQVRADGSQMSDAIRREIEVLPDGKEFNVAHNGRLEGTLTKTIEIPQSAVPGASKILVRMYPGVFSQVIEGMESMLRLPGG